MRKAFALTGLALTALLVVAALQDFRRDWREVQKRFKSVATKRASTDAQRAAIERMDEGIVQTYLPALGKADRCQTCHLGIENPAMAGAEQPFAAHPGKLLTLHPSSRFGCTICHHGQGLATDAESAHAQNIKHWEEPLLAGDYVQASCERCHRGVEVAGANLLNEGRQLFARKGCAGCHKVYGKGGVLGPELTGLGGESIYHKHPVLETMHEYTERTAGDINLAYIMESIKAPAAQPATTVMPDYGLNDWEVRALTVYVKSLDDRDVPSSYRPPAVHQKEPDSGRQLFVAYCSACHGAQGQGGYKIGRMGTALHNDDFLALASTQFLQGVIRNGRNSHNKVMPAWRDNVGGLDDDEINRLVTTIESWKQPPPSLAEVKAAPTTLAMGAGLYRRNCADCHGSFREGKIGPSLVAPQFFQVASERMLYETLAWGRPGTAMPAWNTLLPEQLHALMLYLQSHDAPSTTMAQIPARGDAAFGARLFSSRCATCHGREGVGDLAPSLNSPEFAALADDTFIKTTLVKGRKDAGMPAWSQMAPSDLAAVLAYLRSLAKPARLTAIPTGTGLASRGQGLFTQICAPCHGVHGEGASGPSLGGADLLDAVSDRYLLGIAKYGRSGTQMRPMGRSPSSVADLSDAQLVDVIAYIRSLGGQRVVKQSVRGSISAGAEWYGRVCNKCHGEQGHGGTGPALSNPSFLTAVTDGYLQATLALGRSGTEMRPMTRHAGGVVEFNSTQINDVIAYLRDVSGQWGQAASQAQTAFGDINQGQEWFGRICAKCHGNDGRGTVAAPGLNDKTFLGYASDGFIQGTMIRGRMQTGMRDFGRHGSGVASLSARQITNITHFIRSWSRPEIAPASTVASSTLDKR